MDTGKYIMRLTVSIITRNRSDHLKRCLNSLVKQNNNHFEVLIVDNASTDNTKIVASSFKRKLKIKYVYETQIGRPNARNRVLKEVKKGILATIDDDCEASFDWIKTIINAHKKFPGVIAIHGFAVSKPKDNYVSIIAQFIKINNLLLSIKDDTTRYSFKKFVDKPVLTFNLDTKNSSFKVDKLHKFKLNFDTKWRHAEDFQFAKQILSINQKIIFDPKIKVFHWERGNVRGFFGQRFYTAMEIQRTELSWSKSLFSERRKGWKIKRIVDFYNYLIMRDLNKKIIPIFFIFALEESLFLIGKKAEYLRFMFKMSAH